jgi:transposase, IS6 family
MRFHRRRRRVEVPPSGFAGLRFPAEVILLAVRWYLMFGLSYRHREELLAERGIDHVTLYRWVHRFTPQPVDAARASRHSGGDRWFVDETYLKVSGRLEVPLPGGRPVRPGHRRDALGQPCDAKAARRFFHAALHCADRPVEVTTDRAAIYPPVLDELLPGAFHEVVPGSVEFEWRSSAPVLP